MADNYKPKDTLSAADELSNAYKQTETSARAAGLTIATSIRQALTAVDAVYRELQEVKNHNMKLSKLLNVQNETIAVLRERLDTIDGKADTAQTDVNILCDRMNQYRMDFERLKTDVSYLEKP